MQDYSQLERFGVHYCHPTPLARNFNIMTGRLRNTLEDLGSERNRSESLLLNVLPETIADRLKDGEEPVVDSFSEVSVMFADIVGFTDFAAQAPPERVLGMLNVGCQRFWTVLGPRDWGEEAPGLRVSLTS